MGKEDKKKKDLTKISDLTEFFHEDDPDLDLQFEIQQEDEENNEDHHEEVDQDEPDLEDQFELDESDSFYESETEQDSSPPPFSLDKQEPEEQDTTTEEDSFSFDEPQEDFSLDDSADTFEPFSEDSHELQEEQETPLHEHKHENFNEEILESPVRDDSFFSQEETPHIESELTSKVPPQSPPPMSSIKTNLETLRFQHTQKEANPAFSIQIEDIKYQEDAEEIFSILEGMSLVQDDTKDLIKESLSNGRALISHISEFTAITLLNKIRNFELFFKMGLSHQIHESKNYQDNSRGLISRENLKQNKSASQNFQVDAKKPQDILTSTTPTLEGHIIKDYIKVVTASRIIANDDLFFNSEENTETDVIYHSLISEVKEKAFHMGANGVVGILFQTIPNQGHSDYQVLCSGNAVCLAKSHE